MIGNNDLADCGKMGKLIDGYDDGETAHSVVVNGKLLYQNDGFTTLDEARLRREIAKVYGSECEL